MGLSSGEIFLVNIIGNIIANKAVNTFTNKFTNTNASRLGHMNAEDAAKYSKFSDEAFNGTHLPPGMDTDDYARYILGLEKLDDISAIKNIDYDRVLKLRKNAIITKGMDDINLTKHKGISIDEYADLRKQTLSQGIRNMVNLEGPKLDSIYGYEVGRFEADHIVSMKEITEMDGFNQLIRAEQIEVLNLEENFIGLGKSTNASKGANNWSNWAGHSKLGQFRIVLEQKCY